MTQFHSCPLCAEESLAERCPHFEFPWELTDASVSTAAPYHGERAATRPLARQPNPDAPAIRWGTKQACRLG